MAKVTLNTDEQRIVSNSDDLIFGNTGIEGVTIAASTTGVKLDQNIEHVSLHGNIGVGQVTSGFLFQQVGNNLNIYSGTNTLLTRVLVQDDADGTLLTFSNGTVHAKFDTTGATPVIKIGDATVSTTVPAAVTVGQSSIDTSIVTPEPPTVPGNLFTLTGATTTVTHVDVADPTHGTLWWNGVPVEAKNIEDYFKEIAGTEFANLSKNLTDIAGIGDIKFNVDSSAKSSTDATKGGTSTSGPTTGGETTNSATVTYNLTGGGTIDVNTTVTLDYLAFLKSMIFDSTGKSILTFLPEADKTTTHIESAAIVLTTITNNGGTFEGGLTTTGNDTIVAGRPELLHGAYIDAGGGTNNVLNVEMKGVFAQPLELLNIQTINVENAPNIYTTKNPDGTETSAWPDSSTGGHYEKGSDGVVKYYPPGTAGTYPYLSDGTRLTSSTLDLTNAPNVSLLDITELKTFGDITQRPIDLGPLTIVGIQNNATIRLEGDFTEKVTLQYGKGVGVVTTVDGQSVYTGEINVELRLGNTDHFCLDVAVNASGLHLDSQGRTENFFDHLNLGGDLSALRITGSAALIIEEALDGFRTGAANHPAIIDASANTGGVVLKVHEDYVKFTGSLGSDSFSAKSAHHNDDAIVTILADKSVADNIFNAEDYHVVKITSGSGSDTISVCDSETVTIKAGDGDNAITVEKFTTATITSGSGNDVINAHVTGRPMEGTKVTIDAGAGDNIIDASAAEITITTLGGNDTITVHGTDDDTFNGLVKISTGLGSDTVILKHLDAVAGSSITGTNVKLFVEKHSDLRYATLSGVTSVVMEENLTLNFATLVGLGAKVFSVDAASLPNTEVKVIVTESHTLSEVLDLSTLAKNVRLTFEISSGATLTLTAEQLDKYVAVDGISVKVGDNGKVHITDAGQNFNPLDHGNYDVTGGTLDAGWKGHTDDLTVDRLDGTKGWERPAPTPSVDQLIIDSTSVTTADYHVVKLANSVYAIDTVSPNLVIKGNQNVIFDAPVNLGEHDHHDARFTIDFSALTGTVKNLTVHQFDNVIKVVGNGVAGTRINVELSNDLGYFSPNHDGGLKSSGVDQYIVTDISDHKSFSVGDTSTTSVTFLKDVDFYLCDNTKDVKVIGLQGNSGHTLHFHDVPWGGVHPSILLQGDGLANWDSGPIKDQGNPDTDNIGSVVVDYFTDGAPAIVNINNGGVALGVTSTGTHRPLHVEGLVVNNANSLSINVADGDAVIDSLAGNSVNNVVITSALGVTVKGSLGNLTDGTPAHGALQSIDASGVLGTFTADLTGINDLSKVTLTGFDKIVFFDKETQLTLTAQQVVTLGYTTFSTNPEDVAHTYGVLDVNHLTATQALDLSAIQVGHIGTVTIEKFAGLVKLDAGTNFGNAHEVDIYAGTTLEMTALQFSQIENGKFGKWSDGQEVTTLGHGDAILIIDGLAGNAKLNLSEIDVETTIIKVLDNFTATKELEILNDHHHGTKIILEIDGANSVVDLTLAKQIDKFDQIHVTSNATLKLTGHQVDTLGGDLYDIIKIDPTATVKLEVIGTVDAGERDFGHTINITGLNVVTMNIDHFEMIKEVIGTGTNTTFDVILHGDVAAKGNTNGLKSTGVQTYIVDNILTKDGSASFYLCDNTKDVTLLGLRESVDKTIKFEQVPWGATNPTFELIGDGHANWTNVPKAEVDQNVTDPNISDIGSMVIHYFWPGAPAVVDINNNHVTLLETSTGLPRPMHVQGLTVINAASLVVTVEDGNVDIAAISTLDDPDYTVVDGPELLHTLTLTAVADVKVDAALPTSLTTIDGTHIHGLFTATLDNMDHAFTFTGGAGGVDLTLDGSDFVTADALHPVHHIFTAQTGTIIDGGAALAHLIINGDVELNLATLAHIKDVALTDHSELTLNATELFDVVTVANIHIVNPKDHATFNLTDLNGTKVFDATLLETKNIDVNTVSVIADPTTPNQVKLDPATNLTGVNEILVPQGTTLSLTAAQFQELQGKGSIHGIDANGKETTDFTVNITDLKQSDVDLKDAHGKRIGFDVTGIDAAHVTLALADASVLLADDTKLPNYHNVDFKVLLGDNQTLTLANSEQADGLNVSKGTHINTTVVLAFDEMMSFFGGNHSNTIDASLYDVNVLKALNTFVDHRNIEAIIVNLASAVTLDIYQNLDDLGVVHPTDRVVVVEPGVTIPGYVAFNQLANDKYIEKLDFTLSGGSRLKGDLILDTTHKVDDNTTSTFKSLTIHSTGTAQNTDTKSTDNVITGDITPKTTTGHTIFSLDGASKTINNNLLNVTLDATQKLVIGQFDATDGHYMSGGHIIFNSAFDPADNTANLTATGTADIKLHSLVTTGSDETITTLNVADNLTNGAKLIITGAGSHIAELDISGLKPVDHSPAISGDGLENLVITGGGALALGTDNANTAIGVHSNTLSNFDASAHTGGFAVGVVDDIDSKDYFTFKAGKELTTLTLTSDTLESGVKNGGWTFDFSQATGDSTLVLNDANLVPVKTVDGSKLNINLGANTTLYINADTNLTDINLSITQTKSIVVADGVTLTLTAAQVNNNGHPLQIIAGADTDNDPTTHGKVNVVDLNTTPADLSGIAKDVAGVVTLKESDILHHADVTLDVATNLGFFTVQLKALNTDSKYDYSGQTIRYNTVAQADNAVKIVDSTGHDFVGTGYSSNVVWLFNNTLSNPIDTSGYSAKLGRVWFSQALVIANGGNVENLFTSLPTQILRVDYSKLTDVDVLLNSGSVNRHIEMVSFIDTHTTGLLDVTNGAKLDHVQKLNLDLGGNVVVGDVTINHVLAPNSETVTFDSLTINSHQVVKSVPGDRAWLAPQGFLNNNNGINEYLDPITGAIVDSTFPGAVKENVLPKDAPPLSGSNSVGNVSVGAVANGVFDLLNVTLNTKLPAEVAKTDTMEEAALTVGTITYAASVTGSTANLTLHGAKDITVKAVDASNVNFSELDITLDTDYTGNFTVTGGSPAIKLGTKGEILNITTTTGNLALGTGLSADGVHHFAGIAGAALSHINVDIKGDVTPSAPVPVVENHGNVDLGVLATVDSKDLTVTLSEGPAATGKFSLTLGKADVGTAAAPSLVAPELADGGIWTINGAGASHKAYVTVTSDAKFDNGGTLNLNNVELLIQGNVDLTTLVDKVATTTIVEGLFLGANTVIEVPGTPVATPATLTLTGGQANGAVITNSPLDLNDAKDHYLTGGTLKLTGSAIGDNLNGISVKNIDLTGLTTGAVMNLADPIVNGIPAKVDFNIHASNYGDSILAAGGNDYILGGAGNDNLLGGAGSDTMDGGAGHNYMYDISLDKNLFIATDLDTVVGSAGDTVQYANNVSAANLGAGSLLGIENVKITNPAGGTYNFSNINHALNITGNDNNNIIYGTAHAGDSIKGGAGNDTLYGVGGGYDTLDGGAGSNLLVGGPVTGHNLLIANDTDTIDGGAASTGNTVQFGAAVSKANLLDDHLLNVQNVVITNTGNAGYDFSVQTEYLNISGNTGNDTIYASSGGSTIYGNAGNDSLVGGIGNDNLYGGDGNDILISGGGSDFMTGNSGSNTFIVDNKGIGYITDLHTDSVSQDVLQVKGADSIGYAYVVDKFIASTNTLNEGRAIIAATSGLTGGTIDLTLAQGPHGYEIYGSTGNDLLVGSALSDTIDGGLGSDSLYGGGGDDTIYASANSTHHDFIIDGGTGTNTVIFSDNVEKAYLENYQLVGIQNVVLNKSSNGDYNFSNQSESLNITGTTHNDAIHGGSGGDIITGGGGTDYLYGGAGNNTFIINNSGTGYIYDLKTGDVLQIAAGASAQAHPVGDFVATSATSNAGNGYIIADMFGPVVPHTIDMSAATGANGFFIQGFNDNDKLTGTIKADTIYGFDGSDTIDGNGGHDTIYLGQSAPDANADTVIIKSALNANAATINWFVANQDILDFGIAGIGGLAANNYAAGAGAAVDLAGANAITDGNWHNDVIVDTWAHIQAFANAAGAVHGGIIAVATDTGNVYYDADGKFTTAADTVVIGTVAGGGALTSADLLFHA